MNVIRQRNIVHDSSVFHSNINATFQSEIGNNVMLLINKIYLLTSDKQGTCDFTANGA